MAGRSDVFKSMDRTTDEYVVLRKGEWAYYSVESAQGRAQALASASRLKTTRPGDYLLLNLRTKMTEETSARTK